MRNICTTVYTYDELSDAAKERARDWYRALVFSDSGDWETVFEDALAIAGILGIEIRQRPYQTVGGHTRIEPCIYFSGFYNQGDGACFEGHYRYAKGASKRIREYAPTDTELHRIADELQAIQKRHFFKLTASMRHRRHYYHSGNMDVDVEHADDVYRDIGDDASAITQLMRDFADWIYRQLEKEYEYQTSDEAVEEVIEANGYEFTEDGQRAKD